MLGGNHIHIYGARMLDGVFKGGFGDFVEGDAFGVLGQLEDFQQVPRDGFAFAVFIGREPDGVCGFGGFLEFGDDLFVSGVNFIGDVKGAFIYLGIFADVAD